MNILSAIHNYFERRKYKSHFKKILKKYHFWREWEREKTLEKLVNCRILFKNNEEFLNDFYM